MMFGKIVTTVLSAARPVQVKLALRYPILDPVIPHVKSFGAFHANLRCQDVMGSGIVRFDGGAGGGLRVT
jgi:hypothetical protein